MFDFEDQLVTGTVRGFYYDIPDVSRFQMLHSNRLIKEKPVLEWMFSNKPATLTYSQKPDVSEPHSWYALTLAVGDTTAIVYVDFDIVGHQCRAIGSTDAYESWPLSTRALVCTHALSDALGLLKGILDVPVSIREVAHLTALPHNGTGLRFSLAADALPAENVSLVLVAPDAFLTLIVNVLSTFQTAPPVPNVRTLKVPVTWRSPDFDVPLTDLRDMAHRDVLLVNATWDDIATGTFWVGDTAVGEIERKGTQTFLRTKLARPGPKTTDTNWRGHEMNETSCTGSLGDVKIMMSIEIDRRSCLLSDIESLDVGSVLPFRNEEPEKVRLLANGETFAEGELVYVDDRIGLRLTRII